MNLFLTNVVFCILVLDKLTAANYALDHNPPSLKCKASKAMSLLQADCTSRKFSHIPTTLDSGTQVLVLTENRISDLPPGSFSRYTSLEYLYLSENFIEEITDDTVNELSYLQVLDLSFNPPLKSLPSSLFQLPYLRKLYVTRNDIRPKNKFTDDMFNIEVKSPLNYLEVANNNLKKIPKLGILPTLTVLNLSSNPIESVSTEDLAPYCSLKDLDLTKTNFQFDRDSCDCYHVNTWIRLRDIKVRPSLPCNNQTFSKCEMVGFSNETLQSYGECLKLIEIQEAAALAKSKWTIGGSCIGAFFVCLLIGLYCVYKRNKKRRTRKLKEQQKMAANNANTELLNSNLPEPVKTLHEQKSKLDN